MINLHVYSEFFADHQTNVNEYIHSYSSAKHNILKPVNINAQFYRYHTKKCKLNIKNHSLKKKITNFSLLNHVHRICKLLVFCSNLSN